jgi:hypothetical protein
MTKRGEPLPINQAMNRPRAKLGLDLSTWMSASIRLTETTADQINQYAAFIKACADDVVEQALTYVFSKDRDFQEFRKTPQAKQANSTLRVRKVPALEAATPTPQKPTTAPVAAFASQVKSA